MMIFKPWDIVVVPFPFVDNAGSKSRPALVLSDEKFNMKGLIILSMITTARKTTHLFDVVIRDLPTTGLSFPSVVRWKMFTLDLPIIKKKIGKLSEDDKSKCLEILKTVLPI